MDQQARTAALDIESMPRGRMLWRFVRQIAFALISIVVLVVVFGVLNPRFLSGGNWFHIAQQVAVIAILATGQTFIIATAGIDISQGSVVALSSMICAIAIVDAHMPPAIAIVLTLALGAVIGAIIGLSVVALGVPPFIATLGMLAVALGAALLTTNGTPVFGLPNGFQEISQGTVLGFPNMAWIAVLLALFSAYLLNKTRFGRYTLAIGSNAEAARRVGINVPRHLLLVYVFGGIVSSLAGVIYLAYTAAAQPTSGGNYELYAIAAVVIGGGSLFGGVGTILGSILGALLMTILKNGTQLAGISPYVEQVILGIVVVGAVYVDNLRRRLR
ncbi:MAG TPA: ABC transporter permease [Acidiphilium sp.]|jgi:ribose transport system permease protein|uniref:ABC transporter permease n=1 Tax=unclassified Acidiphilium TaxID=2617493 RepID=UPI000BD44515|nr:MULTISPECIES: ABC transporter permease [unclassified Acidiphilium]OYV57749.1 MAG: ATPase [Acidiphilium sp. 20-67-58]OYV87041.1 MAG: ATPase [Acidiphilium sp. 21-68-69]HQT60053.1 ABC transporter permease [Acidiphilium sp.]HQU10722.1 ABC transporter permease [Acidiphilium sp.]